jgi:hypothetical protein
MARFVKPIQCLAVFFANLNDGFDLNAFLVEFAGALVIRPHLHELAVDFSVSFFNSVDFIEHSTFKLLKSLFTAGEKKRGTLRRVSGYYNLGLCSHSPAARIKY